MSELKVFFNKFWYGFLDGNNPNTSIFFIELFKRVFNKNIITVYNYNDADILCENTDGSISTLINEKNWKYSFLVTGESVVSFGGFFEHYNKFMCFLGGADPKTGVNWVKFPLITSYLYCNKDKILEPVLDIPKKIACSVISNHMGKTRNKFIEKLESKVFVTHGGNYKNNIGYRIGGDHNSNELLNFMREHKFVITMENNEEDYYITEKICNGLFAGIIPVYWGSKNISEYINKDRILHLENDSNEEIDRIINEMINMDDETYMKKVNSKIFIYDDMMELVVNDIKKIIE